jgi:hypothetical protein
MSKINGMCVCAAFDNISSNYFYLACSITSGYRGHLLFVTVYGALLGGLR